MLGKHWKRFRSTMIFWPLVIFLVILLVNTAASSGAFLSLELKDGHLYGRLIDIFRNASRLMLLATGVTMVIATGGTDISVGSLMAISGAIACSIVDGRLGIFDGSVLAAVVIAVLACTILGAWNGFLVSKVKIQPIVATMIVMVAGRGLAQLVTNGKIVTINTAANVEAYYNISGGYLLGLPVPIFIVLAVVAAVMLINSKTSLGLFIEASGCNHVSSAFCGINVNRIKFIVYTFSGFCAGVAGLIESAAIKGADCNNAGLFIEMDAILAVAIGGSIISGGKFSIPASLVGALIIQSISTSIYAMGVPPEVTKVVKAIIVILICLAQSPQIQNAFKMKRAKKERSVAT